jgi:hypothetical protein
MRSDGGLRLGTGDEEWAMRTNFFAAPRGAPGEPAVW